MFDPDHENHNRIETDIEFKNSFDSLDGDGLLRRIFSINVHGKRMMVSFRGREELPVLPEQQHSSFNVVIGRSPIHLPDHQVIEWRRRMRSHDQQKEHYFVSVTPDLFGFYQLLLLFSQDSLFSDMVRKKIQRIERWEYDSFDWGVLDKLLLETMTNQDHSGKALIELALRIAGNENPAQCLHKIVADREYPVSKDEAKEYAGVAVFHCTDKYPQEITNGLSQPDRFSGSEGQYIRNSFHTTLHQPVRAHLTGSWEAKGYILVGDLHDILLANGRAYAGYDHDTWWTRNPGEHFRFPHGWIIAIQQATSVAAPAILIKDHVIFIKAKSFSSRDVKEILRMQDQLLSTPSVEGMTLEQVLIKYVLNVDDFLISRTDEEKFYRFYADVSEFVQILCTEDCSFQNCSTFFTKKGFEFSLEKFQIVEHAIYLYLRSITCAFVAEQIRVSAGASIDTYYAQIHNSELISHNELGALHNGYPHDELKYLAGAYDNTTQRYSPRKFDFSRVSSFDNKTRRCIFESGIYSTAQNLS